MQWQIFLTVFLTVFTAEIGDKTQLATMLFASDVSASKWTIFAAASLALVLAAGIGVLAGAALSSFIPERSLKVAAGILFMAIGVYTAVSA